VSDAENSTRRRQVAWPQAVVDLAGKLAASLGYYPEKINGGVSKMLSDLVLSEASGRNPTNCGAGPYDEISGPRGLVSAVKRVNEVAETKKTHAPHASSGGPKKPRKAA